MYSSSNVGDDDTACICLHKLRLILCGLHFTDKSDELIAMLDRDNRQLIKNISMLKEQFSALNGQLNDMRRTDADHQV